MKTSFRFAFFFGFVSHGLIAVSAQDITVSVPIPADSPAQMPADSPLVVAMMIRREMAASVAGGGETPTAAITRLRAMDAPSGLNIESNASRAFAMIDIGHRLLSARKPDAAETFFREADNALTLAIEAVGDRSAAEKAQYLGARADIRANFLNQALAAKTDIDAAIQLQPDSEYYSRLRNSLARERSEAFKPTAAK